MAIEPPRTLCYLLRLWSVETENGRQWRASLESIDSSKRTGFADLEALLDFLEAQTATHQARNLPPIQKGD